MRNIDIKYLNFDSGITDSQASKYASHKILESIKAEHSLYKIFSYDHAKEQAKACSIYAQEINKNFSDLIVIGMGGATLNPKTLTSIVANVNRSTQLHFLNNTDSLFLQKLLAKISLKDCAVLAISNSGETLETISLVGVIISEFEKAAVDDIAKHFYFITNSRSGILKNIANKIGATLIEHTANISGRYSGLTNVSTFVGQIAGINIGEYLDGAKSVLDDFRQNKEESQPALSAATIYNSGKCIMANMGYLQQFSAFLEWYSQIIAESLGKDGKGISPIKGLGPNDQHSMLQLYLDGPQDKIYSLFYVENLDSNKFKTCRYEELGFLANKTLQDINKANFEATTHALKSRGAPIRQIILKDLSAKTAGSLIAHSMLEIVILGHLMQLNPFNQPGVELIKKESTRIVAK
jgi:glucose-6-phosphate isomerase